MSNTLQLPVGINMAQSIGMGFVFEDPISFEIMKNAMMTPCGHSFSESTVNDWLASGHNTCPLCNHPLRKEDVKPNYTLREAITKYLTWKEEEQREKQRKLQEERKKKQEEEERKKREEEERQQRLIQEALAKAAEEAEKNRQKNDDDVNTDKDSDDGDDNDDSPINKKGEEGHDRGGGEEGQAKGKKKARKKGKEKASLASSSSGAAGATTAAAAVTSEGGSAVVSTSGEGSEVSSSSGAVTPVEMRIRSATTSSTSSPAGSQRSDSSRRRSIYATKKPVDIDEDDEETAKLMVGVICGRSLAKRGRGNPDTYCVLKFQGREKRTAMIKSNREPQWRESIVFDVDPTKAPNSELEVRVMDSKLLSSKCIGILRIPFADISSKSKIKKYFALERRKKREKASGDVRLSLQYIGPKSALISEDDSLDDSGEDDSRMAVPASKFMAAAQSRGAAAGGVIANREYVQELVDMGFDRDLCVYILCATNNDMQATMGMLMEENRD